MSDDDLIRRGDALYAIAGWEIPSTAIAALPARGVGVKPLVWKREADNAWVAAHYAIHQYWPHNSGPFAVSGWYLSGLGVISLGKHPTLEAAKAAAQADYEARILAALEPAPTDAAHVNETLKSEHDAGNVLTAAQDDPECTCCGGTGITYQTERRCACQPTDAAQAPAEDAHVKGETAGQMLERLGMDGAKWAAEFRTTALRLGYSDMDEGWLVGWFCNAIMAGYDRSAAQAREAALLQRAAQLAYEVWDDPEALEKAILALGEART